MASETMRIDTTVIGTSVAHTIHHPTDAVRVVLRFLEQRIGAGVRVSEQGETAVRMVIASEYLHREPEIMRLIDQADAYRDQLERQLAEGVQAIGQRRPDGYRCRRCGETDPARFQSGQKRGATVCDDCAA